MAEELVLTQTIHENRSIQLRVDDPNISEAELQALKKAGITSLLLLPLIAQNKTTGLVELQDTRKPRDFSAREIYLAQTLSQQAAVAIENARLFDATRRQLQELTLLHQVSIAATEATSEDELIARATKLIHESFYTDNFGILLINKDGSELLEHPSYKSVKPTKNLAIPLNHGVTGQVASSGASMRVGDTRKDTNYLNYDSESLSELCVPLKIGDRVIGVANAESKKLNYFSEKDERLLLTLAGQLASGIERLRNAAAERQRAKQLSVLNKLAGEMSGVLDRERLFKVVVERLNKEMNYVSTDISRVDDEHREYIVEAVSGTFAPIVSKEGYHQPFGIGLLDIAAKTGDPVVANNVHEQPNYKLVPGHEMVNSELIIPIKIYKRVVALLNIESNDLNAFDQYEVASLTTLCEQISVALESISLFDSTRRQLQELTVLHAITHAAVNAKSEDDLLERATEIIGASIYPDQFGFLMLDEDGQYLTVNRYYRGVNGEMHSRRFAVSQGIAGRVAATGKPWRIPDVRREPNYFLVNPSMRSELAVPILGNGNRVLGVINAESAQLDAFTDADMRLLNTSRSSANSRKRCARWLPFWEVPQRVHGCLTSFWISLNAWSHSTALRSRSSREID
jgi:GAF domain-containing protein